jgi:hypothetical protein
MMKTDGNREIRGDSLLGGDVLHCSLLQQRIHMIRSHLGASD